jgi:hypothetical protein
MRPAQRLGPGRRALAYGRVVELASSLSVSRGLARGRDRPVLVSVVVVLVVYGCIAGYRLHHDGIAGSVDVGRIYYEKAQTSPTIATHAHPSTEPGYAGANGYDGEFYYFIALDPGHAHNYLVEPGYAYSRIVYPMLSRWLALDDPDAIPYMMLIVNLCAIALTTFLLARWLAARGVSPTLALVYGLFPGLVFSGLNDLTEPLAFFFVAAGVVVFLGDSPRRTWLAAPCFALALLTRETTALFPLVLGLYVAFRGGDRYNLSRLRNLGLSAGFMLLALGPAFVLRLLLTRWLGGGTTEHGFVSLVPFAGIIDQWAANPEKMIFLIIVVAIPGAIWALWGGRQLVRQPRNVWLWLLTLNVLAFVVFLHAGSYIDYRGAGRASIGVVLAAVFAVGSLRGRGRPQPLQGFSLLFMCVPWFLPWLIGLPGLPWLVSLQ